MSEVWQIPIKSHGDTLTADVWNALRRAALDRPYNGGGDDTTLAWATTSAAWDEDSTTWQVTSVELFSGATFDGDDPLSISNPMALNADDAQKCLIGYNDGEEEWQVLAVKRGADEEEEDQTVVTDYQVDTSTNKFQKKTRTLAGRWTGDESSWTDVHTGTDSCT